MILDIIVAIVLAFGFYIGFQRGLIKTVFDTASIFVGLLATLKLAEHVGGLVDSIISVNPGINWIISIVITFIVVMALIRFLGKKLEDIFKAINLNSINKLAGGALQAAFFALLVSLSLYFLDNLKLLEEKTKSESKSYTMLEPLPRHSQEVFVKLKPLFIGFWEKTKEAMDDVNQKIQDAENEPK